MPAGRFRCKMFETRYVCSTSAERLAMIGAAPTNKLAESAGSLPAAMQGQAQMLVDAANYRLGSKLDGIDRYITDAGMLVVSAKMERGKLSVHAKLPGTLVGEGKKLAASPSSLAGKIGSERPSGFVRLRMDPTAFPIPDETILPGVKLSDIIRSLTGELVSYAHAGTNGSIALQLGLTSSDTLAGLLKMGCEMSGMAGPFLKLKSEGSTCKGTVDMTGMPAEARGMFVKNKLDVNASVQTDRLELRMAMGESGPVTNAPSPSKLGADLLSGSWNAAIWAEGLSPIYLNELVNVAAARNMGGKELSAAMWLIGHLYEGGFGVGFRDDGLHAVFEISTFAAGSDEEYAGYEAALSKAIDGNFAGAQEALEALGKNNADGIIARQVGLRSGSWIGALGAGAFAWFGTMRSSDEKMDAAAVPTP